MLLRLAWISFLLCSPLLHAETIVVQTTDGRRMEGVVDDNTTRRALWIRIEEGPIMLATALDWEQVNGVTIDGREQSPDQWQDVLLGHKSPRPEWFLSLPTSPPIETIDLPPALARPHVASVVVDAEVASWDHDVELDGLLVSVAGLDDAGQPVAMEGTLELRLVGERMNRDRVIERGQELERWTVALRADHFCGGPAELKLPFRHINPDRDFSIGAEAELTGTVGIAGQGRVAVSRYIVLQEFSPVRDRWQERTGTRILPGER